MRILFMGTPDLAAKVLVPLSKAYDVVGVFTRPDAVRGRGKALVASPVKSAALELGLDVRTPETLKGADAAAIVDELAPDVICVVAYGAILPKSILEKPRYGCLNVHTSLLPRWRGAAPIQRAILAGDETTGVSIMKMEEGLDTGPFCAQQTVPVDKNSLEELEGLLASAGASLLIDSIAKLEDGSVSWREQPSEGVTYAEKIQKAEMKLEPTATASQNAARVRASSAAHPARTVIAGKTLTVISLAQADDEVALQSCRGLESGQAVYSGKRLFLMASDLPLEVLQVKPDGKKSMDAKAFASGLQGIKGKTFAWGIA